MTLIHYDALNHRQISFNPIRGYYPSPGSFHWRTGDHIDRVNNIGGLSYPATSGVTYLLPQTEQVITNSVKYMVWNRKENSYYDSGYQRSSMVIADGYYWFNVMQIGNVYLQLQGHPQTLQLYQNIRVAFNSPDNLNKDLIELARYTFEDFLPTCSWNNLEMKVDHENDKIEVRLDSEVLIDYDMDDESGVKNDVNNSVQIFQSNSADYTGDLSTKQRAFTTNGTWNIFKENKYYIENGTSGFLTIPYSSGMRLVEGPWTVDFMLMIKPSSPSIANLWVSGNSSSDNWSANYSNSTHVSVTYIDSDVRVRIQPLSGNTARECLFQNILPQRGVMFHFSVGFENDIVYCSVDGRVQSMPVPGPVGGSPASPFMRFFYSQSIAYPHCVFRGLRVTTGVARFKSDFNPDDENRNFWNETTDPHWNDVQFFLSPFKEGGYGAVGIFRDWIITTGDFLGNCVVTSGTPNSTHQSEWTPSSPGDNHQRIAYTYDQSLFENSYLEARVNGKQDLYGFTYPDYGLSDSDVVSLSVNTVTRIDKSGTKQHVEVINLNDIESIGQPHEETYSDYKLHRTIFDLDPNNEPWTVNKLSDLKIGQRVVTE